MLTEEDKCKLEQLLEERKDCGIIIGKRGKYMITGFQLFVGYHIYPVYDQLNRYTVTEIDTTKPSVTLTYNNFPTKHPVEYIDKITLEGRGPGIFGRKISNPTHSISNDPAISRDHFKIEWDEKRKAFFYEHLGKNKAMLVDNRFLLDKLMEMERLSKAFIAKIEKEKPEEIKSYQNALERLNAEKEKAKSNENVLG
jgi:hypothetical protein